MKMKRSLKHLTFRIMPEFILKKIQDRRSEKQYPRIIYNLGIDIKQQPKVLFSYLPNYLFMENWSRQYGTRHVECAAFVKALLNKECCVDICDCNNEKGIRSDYDYIIGFGPAFRRARFLNPTAKSILYLTEKTPDFSYKKEKERIDYFYERHQIKKGFSRSGQFFKNDDFVGLDMCIMIGNQSDLNLLPGGIKSLAIAPTGLKNELINHNNRHYKSAKKHFLWLGSSGAIHKGLDILIDVFRKHPELTLHIVGMHWSDRPLMNRFLVENTIDYGYMNIGSKEFAAIVEKCAYCISPSCSEAVSTSVITAMNHGLIPLVSEESSFDLDDIGETLTDFHLDYIEGVVMKWSQADDLYLEQLRDSVLQITQKKYSLSTYSNTIRAIINEFIM